MLRFWLLGAIILTAAADVISPSSTCIGKCALTPTSNEYLPHQQCDKYCACISGQPQIFHCQPNSHWSQEYGICIHPAEAKCPVWINTTISTNALDLGCRQNCSSNDASFLAHNDCEKYCFCSDNSVSVFTCRQGHFSDKSNSCVAVKDAGCIPKNSTRNTTRLPIVPSTTLRIANHECLGSCPDLEDPSHTVFLAHRNCSKYCHCKKDHPTIRSCPANFLFSLKDMRCRRPKDVDCNQVNPTTTIIIPPSDKAVKRGCRTQCPSYNAIIPHKRPSRFCLCRDGKVVRFKCPKSYYFNADHDGCICTINSKPINSVLSFVEKLFNSSTTAKPYLSTSVSTSTEPAPLTAESLPTSTESLPSSTAGLAEEFHNCVGSCTDDDLDIYGFHFNVTHKECNKYCECYNGNIIKVSECSAGYKFDKFFRICQLSKYVDCDDNDDDDQFVLSTTLLPTTSTLLPEPTEPAPLTAESLPTSTESLPSSTAGLAEEFHNCVGSCTDDDLDIYGFHFNVTHKECNKYCECYNGNIIKVSECSAGYRFDKFFRICQLSKYVDCDDDNDDDQFASFTTLLPTTSTLLPEPTEPAPSTAESLPISTTGLAEEFHNCLESCTDGDSDIYGFHFNVSHKECNKYCECYNGNIIKVSECSAGYRFDTFFRTCQLLDYVYCGDDDDNNGNDDYDNDDDDQFTSFTTLLPTTSTSLSEFTEPAESLSTSTESLPLSTTGLAEEFKNCLKTCPGSDSHHYTDFRVPHRECNKYCQCHKGYVVQVAECSDHDSNKLFEICNTSTSFKCIDSVNDSSTFSTTSLSNSSIEQLSITQPFDDANDCLGNCTQVALNNYNTVVNVPSRHCNKYCECYQGEAKVKECPLTHSFDWIQRECVISKNAFCLNYTNPTTTPPPSTSSSPIENSLVTSSPDFTDDFDCAAACPSASSASYNEFVKIPHRDCKKYCECYQGNLTVTECPLDSYFNFNFQTCDIQNYVTCYEPATSASPVPPSSSDALPEITEDCIGECPEPDKMNYAVFLKHKTCQKYCECFQGRLTVKSCPVGSYFNSNLGACDQMKYVECQDANETAVVSSTSLSPDASDCLGVCVSNDVYLMTHKNCRKYCECNHGCVDVKSCPSDLYFNSFTKRCEETEFDDCTHNPNTSVTIVSEFIVGCAEDCPHYGDDDDDTRVDLIPHKQCEKYCICSFWDKPLVMSCGPNSHFNPTLKKCDYVEKAGCQGFSSMSSIFAPQVMSSVTKDCPECPDSDLYSILLKISGIKNGSQIDLKIGDPDGVDSTSNNNDDGRFLDMPDGKYGDSKKLNGLVDVLANLRERARCIGECPEPSSYVSPVYLSHQNCQRACKCDFDGMFVMECHNNFYWNPETEECGPIIYPGCTEQANDIQHELNSEDSSFGEIKKFMGW